VRQRGAHRRGRCAQCRRRARRCAMPGKQRAEDARRTTVIYRYARGALLLSVMRDAMTERCPACAQQCCGARTYACGASAIYARAIERGAYARCYARARAVQGSARERARYGARAALLCVRGEARRRAANVIECLTEMFMRQRRLPSDARLSLRHANAQQVEMRQRQSASA